MHMQLLIVTIEQLFRTPEGHFPRMAVLLRQLTFQSLISRFCVDEAHSFYTAGFALYGLPAFRPSWGKLPELKASLRPSIPWHLLASSISFRCFAARDNKGWLSVVASVFVRLSMLKSNRKGCRLGHLEFY